MTRAERSCRRVCNEEGEDREDKRREVVLCY